ncbi:MAG: PQQ-dependent sugar dehydrogenase [Gemmatimonadales bacterium]|nr:MAG: PQQ-dependent sugar dehydrogenase [Gemmatimonadales bacterium]
MSPSSRHAPGGRVLALLLAGFVTLLAACSNSEAASGLGDEAAGPESADWQVVTAVDGLIHPWGIAFVSESEWLVTERPGRLRVVRDGALVDEPVDGVPQVHASNQGGLLDVALHPDFDTNRLVYLSYSRDVGGGQTTTAVVRGEFDGSALTGVEDVVETRAVAGPGRHYGSRIDFDADGYLYVTVGDRGQRDRAQDLTDHVGTTLRLHDDGRVPEDNPFVGRDDALPEIWTYGNRNAQGQAVDLERNIVWQNEHGPRGGDELNRMEAGLNYGWPEITHGINYDGSELTPDTARAGMEQPVVHWTPSIAVSGMALYTGDVFPEWQGDLFVGALRQQHIRRLHMADGEVVEQEVMLDDLGVRFREIAQGPDGLLYLLTDERNGEILRLEPAGGE